jgi:hypothetical protein
MRISWECF